MIEAGACCIQIENQVSDVKQCGHQDGKVTVPHEEFHAKINAVRYAFLELGVDDGVIVARTDSEGAGLTQAVPVSNQKGDLASQYISFLKTEEVTVDQAKEDEVLIKRDGKLVRPARLPSGLFEFAPNTNIDRVVLDCITRACARARICCGLKPQPLTSKTSPKWSTVCVNKSPPRNWCTTTHHHSTGL